MKFLLIIHHSLAYWASTNAIKAEILVPPALLINEPPSIAVC